MGFEGVDVLLPLGLGMRRWRGGSLSNAVQAGFDIAGTAWTGSTKPDTPVGATGVGVRLLINYLRHL